MRKLLVLWAAIFIAAHIPLLPSSLADLDSINFGLAVRDFDVTRHQPHPPGYPHYVGLTRITAAALHKAGDPHNLPHALALVNVLGAAAGLIAIYALARALGCSTRRAFASAVLAGCVPLYFFTAGRPLSDMPGLAVAVASQAMLWRAITSGSSRYAYLGAACAGIGLGFRIQGAALTFPMAALMLASRKLPARSRMLSAAALAAGALTWLAPMIVDVGIGGLIRAFTDQTREDFTGVQMLATHPGLRLAVEALYETFVDPFGQPILAAIVLTGAALGAVLSLRRDRGLLLGLALGYLPYLIFHLLFQETITNRYAVPLVVPIAILFAQAAGFLSERLALPIVAGVATAGLLVVIPAGRSYAGSESPGFALIRDMHRLPRLDETVLGMHQRIASDLRRHQEWEPLPAMRTLPPTVDYEWLELANLWQNGFEGPIWFLADPKRTDLKLIDPQQRKLLRQYGWPEQELPFVGGIRPNRIDWYYIQRPGWFLGKGWALSPEIGGLTARDRTGPGLQPALAWVRRRAKPATMTLGGRHLGAAGDQIVTVRVSVDGKQIDEWGIRPGPFVFMRPVLAEELAGEGLYARLEVSASWPGGGDVPIALEQFDLQSIDGAMVAYDQGWWEPEYSPTTGASWRWSSGESKLWLFNPGRDVTLVVSGEDPTRYYRGGTEMTVLVGEKEIGRFPLDSDFSRSIVIPAEPLSVAHGRVTLRFSKTHVPGRIGMSPDQRELGVRIYDVSVY